MKTLTNRSQETRGYIYALAAALLFGASPPFAKKIMHDVNPWMMAGILYFGAGVGLLAVIWIRKLLRNSSELSIKRKDLPALAAAVFWGGMVGPVLLMFGLSLVSASTAALFLNFEAVFTAIIAWSFFRESFDNRIALGIFFIVAGGIALSWGGSLELKSVWGPLLILGACFSWGLDNNFTGKVSMKDPIQIVLIKSLVAGSVNILLAKISGAEFPKFGVMLSASFLGFASYGVSLIMFVLALRHIGASRTGAYFAIAPFFGALLAVSFFGESLSEQIILGSSLMATGVVVHLCAMHKQSHSIPRT